MFSVPLLRRTFDAAVRDLRSTKPEVRASAARDLGLVGDEHPRAASDALSPLLDDTWSNVRAAALEALGTLSAQHLTERIARCIDDGDSQVRQLAVVSLAHVGGPRALEHLIAGATHGQADVRYQCLLGVLSIDPRAGFTIALEALSSDDAFIASEAAEQIGRLFAIEREHRTDNNLGDAERTRARAALGALLEASSGRVRVAVAMSLTRMGETSALPLLCEFVRHPSGVEGADVETLVAEALELLGSVGPEAAEEARAALASVAWRVIPSAERGIARAALARLGDSRAKDELVEQLRSLIPGRRETAVKLARIARLREAEGTLLSLLDDGGVEPAFVIDTLGAVGGERSIATLSRLARTHERADLRDAARRSLARIEERP